MKKLNYLLLFVLGFIVLNNNVLANNNTVDFSKKGTIDITLTEKEDNIKVSGAEITIYKVADATEENRNLVFEYSDEFKDCNVALNNLESKTLTTDITKCLNESTKGITQKTDEDGKVSFKDLDLGLYLLKQTNKVKGFMQISPYLVTIPKTANNEWSYNITSKPKTEITKLMDISVQKVWNTKVSNKNDKTNLPDEVTIELYKGEELIDTISLNNSNNWSYTWEDIDKSDEYNVKEVNIPKGYTVSYQQEGNLFIITNTKTLVQTGQMTWLVAATGLLGMVFIISGYIVSKRTNNE